ncbi:hypothetical protein ACFLZN_02075, partial [Nanoarchaeota archaeon]
LPKVGTFQCMPSCYDSPKLKGLLENDKRLPDQKKIFKTRIKQVRDRLKCSEAEAIAYVHKEIPHSVRLKMEIMGAMYARILERLNIRQPVLFSAKGSPVVKIMKKAIERMKDAEDPEILELLDEKPEELKLRFIGGKKGPLKENEKGPYNICHSAPLQRLCNHANPTATIVGKYEINKNLERIILHPCIRGAPFFCEAVHSSRKHCLRDRCDEHCTHDLFTFMEDPSSFASKGLGVPWLKHMSEVLGHDVNSLAQILKEGCDTLGFDLWSAEYVTWELNTGANYVVYSATDFIDDRIMEPWDKRRKKGRNSWHEERYGKVLFPFRFESREAKDPKLRVSSIGLDCHLAKIFAMNQHLPPFTFTSEPAGFGTGAHFLMNGELGVPLLHERIAERLGHPREPRDGYTEKSIELKVDDCSWSGHPDQVLVMADQYSHDLRGEKADLVIVDYKRASQTKPPSWKYVLQLASYAMAISQMNPEVTFENFYLVIVNRRWIDLPDAKAQQKINIVKIGNNENDLFYNLIRQEQRSSLTQRDMLLHDNTYLENTFIPSKMKRGACFETHNGKFSAKCFKEQRERCFEMRKKKGNRTLQEYCAA